MAPGADVRSIAAIRDWVAALGDYRVSAQETLAGIEMELRRSIEWVTDQGSLWQKAVRDCEEDVHAAKRELNARKLPDWSGREPDTTLQERNLRRANAKLEHAQEQVVVCRRWLQKMPKLIEETYRGAATRLSTFLDGELAKAAAVLDRQASALEAYAGLRPDFAPGPSTTMPGPKS